MFLSNNRRDNATSVREVVGPLSWSRTVWPGTGAGPAGWLSAPPCCRPPPPPGQSPAPTGGGQRGKHGAAGSLQGVRQGLLAHLFGAPLRSARSQQPALGSRPWVNTINTGRTQPCAQGASCKGAIAYEGPVVGSHEWGLLGRTERRLQRAGREGGGPVMAKAVAKAVSKVVSTVVSKVVSKVVS